MSRRGSIGADVDVQAARSRECFGRWCLYQSEQVSARLLSAFSTFFEPSALGVMLLGKQSPLHSRSRAPTLRRLPCLDLKCFETLVFSTNLLSNLKENTGAPSVESSMVISLAIKLIADHMVSSLLVQCQDTPLLLLLPHCLLYLIQSCSLTTRLDTTRVFLFQHFAHYIPP